jgi:hypothetical protein
MNWQPRLPAPANGIRALASRAGRDVSRRVRPRPLRVRSVTDGAQQMPPHPCLQGGIGSGPGPDPAPWSRTGCLKASAINEDMGDYAATARQPADVVTILKGQQGAFAPMRGTKHRDCQTVGWTTRPPPTRGS